MNNTLTISNTIVSVKKRATAIRPNISFKKVYITLFILLSISVVLSIVQFGSMIKASYMFSGYEKQLDDLSQQNRALEIKLSQAGSLGSIEELVAELDYEEVGTIQYIRVLEDQVATKQ